MNEPLFELSSQLGTLSDELLGMAEMLDMLVERDQNNVCALLRGTAERIGNRLLEVGDRLEQMAKIT